MANYDFDLPMTVNRRVETKFEDYDLSGTPFQSEYISAFNNRDKSAVTRKSSRQSLLNLVPKRRITAIGLRHAIKLSNPKINFSIPITYYERLKDGGFYEAKVKSCFIF